MVEDDDAMYPYACSTVLTMSRGRVLLLPNSVVHQFVWSKAPVYQLELFRISIQTLLLLSLK